MRTEDCRFVAKGKTGQPGSMHLFEFCWQNSHISSESNECKDDNELTGESVGAAVGLVVGDEVGALVYTESEK